MRFPRQAPVLLVMSLSLLLGACGSNPYSLPKVESGQPSYEEPEPAPVPAPDAPTPAPEAPAISAHSGLMSKAADARSRGDYDQALAYLERAQRIDPDNAGIYLAMAQTHDAAGNSEQARVTAERGLLYCSGNSQCKALRSYTR